MWIGEAESPLVAGAILVVRKALIRPGGQEADGVNMRKDGHFLADFGSAERLHAEKCGRDLVELRSVQGTGTTLQCFSSGTSIFVLAHVSFVRLTFP